jgi:hypothetical protein
MNKRPLVALAVAVLVLGIAAVFLWPGLSGWFTGRSAPATVPQAVQTLPSDAAGPDLAASQAEPPAPAPVADAVPLPPLAEADIVVRQSLEESLGRANVLALLQTDRFVQRMVATVDNLPRLGAPARLWPVNPTPGRFMVRGDTALQPQAMDAANAARYDALVRAVTALPPEQAAAMYRRLYPLFQQAWRELGYPRGEFNTRLLQVLDHLLATPVPTQPVLLTLTEVKGTVPSTAPWLRYEFADPALQALSAGQRALLRAGPAHQRQLMDWMAALRQELRR